MAELNEIQKLLLSLSDQDLMALLTHQNKKPAARAKTAPKGAVRWFDKPISGLNKEGLAHLKALEDRAGDPHTGHQVDKKQLRYLKALKKMKLKVPAFFRQDIDPKQMYLRLKDYCLKNDIPDEIVGRVVPALISYIETGRLRPIIFVGEKGCGKTTAVRMLVETALQLHTEVIKIPQTDGGQGMTGNCGVYHSADVGCIAKARLRSDSILNAYLFDEIDKASHAEHRASAEDELLSITDESNSDIFDNYLETALVGLEHCPMFFTANDLQKVNPILVDRCTVIHFPSANAKRIKSISKKYAQEKLTSSLYRLIRFDFDLMELSIDRLVQRNVTSLRKHQQVIEAVLENALDVALSKVDNAPVVVTDEMFKQAEEAILGSDKRPVGFKA